MAKNRRRKGTPMDGVLLLDKPSGMSSNQALQKAKWLLGAQKVGHTGSLDPIATGLLPLCFGRATKVSGLFLDSNKAYDVEIKLGVSTESGDKEGEIISQSDIDVSLEDLELALKPFIGEISQVPPMYSALKRNGQPLYKLARQGIEVEREPRKVTIHSLDLIDFKEDTLKLSVFCSKGFYIRSLAVDIGESLGIGAHVRELRRTKVGDFALEQCITLDQLEALDSSENRQNLLTPTDQTLLHLPEVDLSESSSGYLCHGQTVRIVQPFETGLTRLYDSSKNFLGLGEITKDGQVLPKRIFVDAA